MVRVGIIARADATGLGVQSRNWVRLLDPVKVIVINSKPFNGNEQHYEWYSGRNALRVDGFIKPYQFDAILRGIDVLLTFEIPYNYDLIRVARSRGIKVILQNNWEFTDYLQQSRLPLPDLLVNHSYWHLDDQKKRWPDITDYCPTPVFIEDYDEIMLENMDKDSAKRRFLHVAGRKTHEDRNGTLDLIEAVKQIDPSVQFELVIKTQTTSIENITDSRIILDSSSPIDEKELYRGFDAVIMPRRYAGACLPMTEALAAGLPVIMTDVDPNNKVLPNEWLVKADKKFSFMARTDVDVYSADHAQLAKKIKELATASWPEINSYKMHAREIAVREYSSQNIKRKWYGLLKKVGL